LLPEKRLPAPEQSRHQGIQYTDDSLFDGRLICRQHRDGYRFSVDAVLLAHFCRPDNQASILDIGCGSGVISLILCYRHAGVTVTGLELQPDLARLAAENSSLNNFQARFTVQQGDLRQIGKVLAPESFDLVVTNPPYRRTGAGRLNQQDECAIARHELKADMDSVVNAAAFAVKNRGAVACIYPADRLAELLSRLERKRLIPKRLQPVYSYPEDSQACLVMVEAVKNGGHGLHLLPPLYIYQYADGPYTLDLEGFYAL
jgi:tRNA1Val (adenine37-N6)-methyltransferase